MPVKHEGARFEEIDRWLDPGRRFVDLAAKFRVIETGETLEKTVGGRWDRILGDWIRPTPPDVEAIEWTVQRQQVPILTTIDRADIFVAIFAGRQAGKTYVAAMQIVIDALRWPGRKSAIISLNYKSSRDPEKTFQSLLNPSWKVIHRKSDREYVFPNGHSVVFRSVEAIDSIRGPSLKTVLMDEAAYAKYEQYVTALGCGAASENFRIYLATTPKRESQWCREVDSTWGRTTPHSRIFRLETLQNPRRNAEFIAAIEASTPAEIVDQEFRGIILAPENAVYARQFNRNLHLREPGELPEPTRFRLVAQADGSRSVDVTEAWIKEEFKVPGCAHIAGWDFGKEAAVAAKIFRDWRVIELVDEKGRVKRIQQARDRLYIVGDLVNKNATTDHHAAEFIERWGKNVFVVTDAMGRHERSDGRGQDGASIEILEDAGFFGVEPVGTRNPGIRHRIRTVNRALLSAKQSAEWPDVPGAFGWRGGEVRLFVSKDCKRVIDALENHQMKNGKPEKDGYHEHVADALGYLVLTVLPVEANLKDGVRRFVR